jgi:hypothetical protein
MSQKFFCNFFDHLSDFCGAYRLLIAGSDIERFDVGLELRRIEGGHDDIFGFDQVFFVLGEELPHFPNHLQASLHWHLEI